MHRAEPLHATVPALSLLGSPILLPASADGVAAVPGRRGARALRHETLPLLLRPAAHVAEALELALGPEARVRVVPDTNSVLVAGTAAQCAWARDLAARLDRAGSAGAARSA